MSAVDRPQRSRAPVEVVPQALTTCDVVWTISRSAVAAFSGDVVTAYLSPDREPIFRSFPVATNHQGIVEWPEQAKATRTIEREQTVIGLLDDPAVDADMFTESFRRAPLFSTSYANGFGTLYTAAYRPTLGVVRLIWPTHVWELGFERFESGEHTEVLAEPTFATSAG